MTEDQKKQTAAFRFGVICDFVGGARLDPGEKEKLLRGKCSRKWNIPFSEKTRISRSAIQRWISLYNDGNQKLESLYPSYRSDRGKSRSMDEETEPALIRLREELPLATGEVLIRTMEQRGLVTPGTELNLSKVYRFLHHHNLMRKDMNRPEDRRKFEAEFPNDLWQSDVMHGPRIQVGDKMRKTYLIGIIDDHSRPIPHAEFYLSENLVCYLDAFEKALLKRGLPRKLYVDNGAAFRSRHLEHTTASLGIALIHARPYKPQGKGKIERWFKTVRSDFLSSYKGQILDELNKAFKLWMNGYHLKRHGSTGQKPFERFTSRMECLRTAPENLKDYFRKAVRRKVGKDRTVTISGRLFEAPVLMIGKQVELLYHESRPEEVEVVWNQKSYGMVNPVDVHVNCRVRRDKNSNAEMLAPENKSEYRGGNLWSGKGGNR